MIDADPIQPRKGSLCIFEPETTVRILSSDEGQGFVARTQKRNPAQRALDKARAYLGRPSEVTVDILIPGQFVPFSSDDREGHFGYFKSLEPSRTLSPRVLAEEVNILYYGRASDASKRGLVLLSRQ